MNLDLNEVQTEVLVRELSQIIQGDRYPLSPRIVTLKEILGQLRRSRNANPCPRDGITSRRAGDDN
jgi:hypothetical protein